jgi:hypothetical protein
LGAPSKAWIDSLAVSAVPTLQRRGEHTGRYGFAELVTICLLGYQDRFDLAYLLCQLLSISQDHYS